MELNLRATTIVKIFVMPDSDDESTQSTFQGFLGEILDEQHIHEITKVSLLPHDAFEIFLANEELINFRNLHSNQTILLLRPQAVIKFIHLLKSHPFVVFMCLQKDIDFILNIQDQFDYKPFLICPDNRGDIDNKGEFDYFTIDTLLYDRLNQVISTQSPPEDFVALVKNKNKRSPQVLDCGFISRMHGVTKATECVLTSLGYSFDDSQPIPGSFEKEKYVDAMLECATNLLSITGTDKDICKSDVVVYSPSIYSNLYKFNSNWWNQLLRPIKDKKVKEFITKGIFKNPSYSGLTIEVEDIIDPYKTPIAREILMIRQLELALTVLSVQLLSISYNAPAIRLPNSVNFHSGEIKELELLSTLHGKKRELNFKKKFKSLTSKLKEEIGSELTTFIADTTNTLTLCTDAPIEWVSFGKIPLMFTHQISKIHTTPGNMLMLQASQPINLTINKEELFKVLVIRSFNDSDPLKGTLEASLSYFVKIDAAVELSIVDVSTEQELINAINKCKCHILIFDCHGNHGGPESHGWLQIGEDKVDTWTLSNKTHIPCIVILSACLTSAVSGSHASVANGLIKSGALAVLGTFLPVNAAKSAIFVGRIIYRLSGFLNAIEKLGVDELTWREFITGFLRMSYCTDILKELRDNYKVISDEQYKKIHNFANYSINTNQSNWFEAVIDALQKETDKNESELYKIIDEIGITETMFYTQLGRPENIRIKLSKD